jgi:hypothetical protein
MTRPGGGDTINSGPAPRREEDRPAVAGNARRKGEDPSPDDRERGETASSDAPEAIDLESTRERAG